MVAPAAPADGWTSELRGRLDELLDEYRSALHDCLGGLSEEKARLRLVPSRTTLPGLLKHATYVEGVWFDQAVSGRSTDTIASISQAHRVRSEASRATMAELALDATVEGRGSRPVWALQLQVLRELAQHAGHADILREQVLARRADREET